MSLDWYALHTKPHKERQVVGALQDRQLEMFFPTTRVPHRRGRSDERAFFPGYVFVRADLAQIGLWGLTYLPGVHRLVAFGNQPATIDPRVIATIRERLGRANVVDQRGEILEPGDRVRVLTGPFADLEAVFDARLSAQGRVRILIHMMERWAKVELDGDALRKRSETGAL
jgi:transcriptional antiterminator RfaH